MHSPKTEHHEGKECRIIPLLPERRTYLEQAFDAAEPGTEYVITRYPSANANLRTKLQRIIIKTGLESWPKLFHNLRPTRKRSWQRNTRSMSSLRGSGIAYSTNLGNMASSLGRVDHSDQGVTRTEHGGLEGAASRRNDHARRFVRRPARFATVASSSCASMGLATCMLYPASIARVRSSDLANAVKAMAGTAPPWAGSNSRTSWIN